MEQERGYVTGHRTGAGLGAKTCFQGSEFIFEVARELTRAERLKLTTSVIVVTKLPLSRAARREFVSFATTELDSNDLAGILGNGDYAVCLPEAGRPDAEFVAERLRDAMATYSAAVGVATLGDDGATAGELLVVASQRALEEELARPV